MIFDIAKFKDFDSYEEQDWYDQLTIKTLSCTYPLKEIQIGIGQYIYCEVSLNRLTKKFKLSPLELFLEYKGVGARLDCETLYWEQDFGTQDLDNSHIFVEYKCEQIFEEFKYFCKAIPQDVIKGWVKTYYPSFYQDFELLQHLK